MTLMPCLRAVLFVGQIRGGLPLQPPHPLLQRGVRLTQLHDQPGLLPRKSDQLLARQLLQPGHSPRSSRKVAPTSRTDTPKINYPPECLPSDLGNFMSADTTAF